MTASVMNHAFLRLNNYAQGICRYFWPVEQVPENMFQLVECHRPFGMFSVAWHAWGVRFRHFTAPNRLSLVLNIEKLRQQAISASSMCVGISEGGLA